MHHELIKFKKLVELGSYSRAAESLRISQPALTIAIQSLEKQYGATLIKSKRPVTLSKRGKLVYTTAQRISAELSRLKHNVRVVGDNELKLSLGTIDSSGVILAKGSLVNELSAVSINSSDRLLAKVENGQLDMAIITSPLESIDSDVRVQPLPAERFLLVCKPSLAQTLYTQLDNQVVENLLAYNNESTTFRHITAHANLCGLKLQPLLYSSSPALIRALSVAGKGCALLPQNYVSAELKSKKLVAISSSLNEFYRPLSIAFVPTNPKKLKIDEMSKKISKLLKAS